MNTDIKNIKKQTNNIYVNKQTTKKTIVVRINLNLIDTLTFIKMKVKNIFLNKDLFTV